jgi:hypothetical protein
MDSTYNDLRQLMRYLPAQLKQALEKLRREMDSDDQRQSTQ